MRRLILEAFIVYGTIAAVAGFALLLLAVTEPLSRGTC